MKKALVLLIGIIVLLGCSKDKYADFDHYKFHDVEAVMHSVIHNYYGGVDTYALANRGEEVVVSGLFYMIDENEYILLEEISYQPNEPINFEDTKHFYFYEDKLYQLYYHGVPVVKVYSLDKEKTTSEEVRFTTPYKALKDDVPNKESIANQEDEPEFDSIEKIEDNYIYFEGQYHYDREFEFVMKCSLEDYECEIFE